MSNYVPAIVAETSGMSEENWLELRRSGIGGSDAAAVLGLSPFQTARDLYREKIGVKPKVSDESNWVAKQVGKRLEDLVAEIFSRKTGLKIVKSDKMYAHAEHSFMLANVDYFVEMSDGKLAVLECKTSNYNCRDKWADGAVPINYELQIRHYMAVLGIDRAFCACLFGNGESEYLCRDLYRDLDFESDLIAQEKFFWEENVLKKVEPPFTESGNLVLESLRRYYGNADLNAPVLSIAENFAEAIEKYLSLREKKLEFDRKSQELEDEMKKAYAPVIAVLGESCSAVCRAENREYSVSFKPVYRENITKERLETLKLLQPNVYDKYVSRSESRRFTATKKEISA